MIVEIMIYSAENFPSDELYNFENLMLQVTEKVIKILTLGIRKFMDDDK